MKKLKPSWKDKEKELVDALLGMYEQYCGNGHLFMNAGEDACEVLKKYGHEFDAAGVLKKY